MARPNLLKHRKFLRLCHILELPKAHALGHLELLWQHAYENGDAYLGDAIDVELAADWQGEAGTLVKALLTCGGEDRAGFIEEAGEGLYKVHDLDDHAPDYVKKRRTRELERKGKTKESATDRTMADNVGQCPPNGSQCPENVRTPTPAPAPTPKYMSDSDEYRLATLLCELIKERKPNFRQPNLQTWMEHIDRMIRLDNRSPAEIESVMRWVVDDSFWAKNVLSPDTLRKQFDRLEMQMAEGARAQVPLGVPIN